MAWKLEQTPVTVSCPLDARLSRRRLWTGLIVAPLLIALCGYMLGRFMRDLANPDYDQFKLVVYALFFVAMGLLFAAVFATFLIELRRAEATLHIDRTSIHDRRLTRDAITWGEVRALQPVTSNAQHYLVIVVDDTATRRAGARGLWALNRWAARLQKRPELAVNLSMLEVEPQQVLALLQQIVPGKMRAPVTEWRIPVP
jgi:hypothetical protein